jgi:anhydro-N-acetylmuramic acid kinase
MRLLEKYFYPTAVQPSNKFGISEQSKEALCFALLANETIHGNSANVPSVTGAQRGTILGTICLP